MAVTTLQGRITLMFVALAVILEALIVFYWTAFLEPHLRTDAEAGMRAMAQSHAQALTEVLSPIKGEIRRDQISKAMDQILLLTDPTTKNPYILAVTLEMDYDVLKVKKGTLDISRGELDCEQCFVTEIPLYAKASKELIGLARFNCSSEFFKHLKRQVRTRIFAISGAVFILLFLGWWVTALLLKPLRQLTASLKIRDIEAPEPLPDLPGRASDEIRMVKLALDELFGKINERMVERETFIEELRRLRNLLSNVINSMPSVLVGVDVSGRVTQWNREAEKMTRMPASEANGRLLSEVFPDLAGEMKNVYQALETKVVQKKSKIPRHINGKTRFSDITVYPLTTDGLEGAVIRVDDVTEQVRLEEMMIQSEKMLSVGGLAAGMAHEINNPLAGIIQNVQVMQQRFSGDLAKDRQTAEECGTSIDAIKAYMEKRGMFRMMDSVMDSGKRAAKIVDNMLSFSRKSDTQFSRHSLGELLDKTVELAESDYDLKKKFDFRQIKIVREYDADIPEVTCEESKIQQVFLNILNNCAQAMAEEKTQGKSPRLILRLVNEREMVRIEIEDNGPGMTETVRKRVFEPFFTTKEVGVGTGLGLSVSYFIITENHGGTITVESSPGAGAKFIIRLPLKMTAAAERFQRAN